MQSGAAVDAEEDDGGVIAPADMVCVTRVCAVLAVVMVASVNPVDADATYSLTKGIVPAPAATACVAIAPAVPAAMVAHGTAHAAMACIVMSPIAPAALVMVRLAANATMNGAVPAVVETDGMTTHSAVATERRAVAAVPRMTREEAAWRKTAARRPPDEVR